MIRWKHIANRTTLLTVREEVHRFAWSAGSTPDDIGVNILQGLARARPARPTASKRNMAGAPAKVTRSPAVAGTTNATLAPGGRAATLNLVRRPGPRTPRQRSKSTASGPGSCCYSCREWNRWYQGWRPGCQRTAGATSTARRTSRARRD